MKKVRLGTAESAILRILYVNFYQGIFNNTHTEILEEYNENNENKVISLRSSLKHLKEKNFIASDDNRPKNYRITIWGKIIVEKLGIVDNVHHPENDMVEYE